MRFGIETLDTFKELTKKLVTILKQLSDRIDTKLESSDIVDFETSAELDVRDTNNRSRTNHTGTQSVDTITGLSDVIKIGTADVSADGPQTFSFSSAFISGTDSDIQVVVTRTLANASSAFSVTATTKTGFTIDRSDSVSGTQTVRYIAVNGSYL